MNRDELLDRLGRPAAPAADGILPTGSVPLDLLLGGGWPAGAISEISGPPGYAEPLAYRTVAAVQRARPDGMVIFCGRDFSLRRADKAGLDTGRLLVTHSPDAAVTFRETGTCLAVVDRTLGGGTPVRADKHMAVLYLTASPGDVRSTACIELTRGRSRGWAWADRMWHTWHPDRLRFERMLVGTGKDAFAQELLDVAVLLDVVTARGRWYYRGSKQIGGGWDSAVDILAHEPGLQRNLLTACADRASVYPGWRHAYT